MRKKCKVMRKKCKVFKKVLTFVLSYVIIENVKRQRVGGGNGVKKKPSLLIPSETKFLSNKDISDRLYVWILLNGEKDGGDTYIDKKPVNGYKKLGISYRTFYKKLKELVENNYLEDCGYAYRVVTDNFEFSRLIYKNIAETLYQTGIDNIIKVYIYLGTLYSAYGKKAYFTFNKLSEDIGYLSKRSVEVKKNMENIISKLEELGLVKCYKDTECGERYHVRYKIAYVKTDLMKGGKND